VGDCRSDQLHRDHVLPRSDLNFRESNSRTSENAVKRKFGIAPPRWSNIAEAGNRKAGTRSREGGDPEGARLDYRLDLSSGTQQSIYARWPLLETNFGEFPFHALG
jgi:hypothetical protein